ncbi:hypothetical protein ACDP63_18175 [Paracoccus sp. P2]|uniref:hypothetical protein n=1 Tax=Paracoccus sp. P2 TaxID=3248840 RepID=UPI00391EF372
MTDSVKRACEQWISAGYGEDCFWEDWPECPCEDSLTPNQVMAAVAKLESENQRLREAIRHADDILEGCGFAIELGARRVLRIALSSTGEKG